MSDYFKNLYYCNRIRKTYRSLANWKIIFLQTLNISNSKSSSVANFGYLNIVISFLKKVVSNVKSNLN